MFSFAKVSTIVLLAFGAFTSAMPTGVKSTRAVEARNTTQPTDLMGILTQLNSSLKANGDLLNGINVDNYSYDRVNTVVLDMKAVIDVAVGACRTLPAGAIGSGDVFAVLTSVIDLILVPCGQIYNLPGVDQSALRGSFSVLGDGLGALITGVIRVSIGVLNDLLGGLLSIVIGLFVNLLGSRRSTIIELNLTTLIQVLAL
ncbi:hypothetical protein OF83DRAFT_917230 [Amylostereum chailletii]|nr:hypothetical protein OF83DRAFT_917230 [Amylostereum chailletii]